MGKSGRALKATALTLAIVAFAVTPLIAQYLKQQVMVSDDNSAMVAPTTIAHARPAPLAKHHLRHKKNVRKVYVATATRVMPVTPHVQAPVVVRHPAPAAYRHIVKHIVKHRPKRIARRMHRRRPPPAAHLAKADLARSAVTGYLERVIAGEIPDAPEKRIVSAWTDIHIKYVQPDSVGLRLGVDLSGPQGRYFEVFVVDRSDLQIVQHSFVQV